MLARVLCISISDLDIHCFAEGKNFTQVEDIPSKRKIIPGFEFVSEIVKIGSGAAKAYSSLNVGDMVVVEEVIPCNYCRFCRTGSYNLCTSQNIFGINNVHGGMANYIKFPKGTIIHKIPSSLTSHEAVLCQPLACSIYAVQKAKIEIQHTVAIIGVGVAGCCSIIISKKRANQVIAIDSSDTRLRVAQKCGADFCINSSRCDIVYEMKKLTRGEGCDVVIET